MSVPLRIHEAFGLNSQSQQLLWWDDFLGDQIDDLWDSIGSAGGSAVVVDAQTGGIVRLTTDNDINDEWRIDWNNIRSLLVNKNACMEIRVKLGSITNRVTIMALQFDGNNRIQIKFDSSVDGNWHITCDNGGVSTDQDSGVAVDTDYHIYRIEATATSVSFFIDDIETSNSPITTNIPSGAGDYLQPFIRIRTLETLAKTMDLDYVVVRQEI